MKDELEATEYVIEATDFERYTLWKEYQLWRNLNNAPEWKMDNSGYMKTVGGDQWLS